MPDYKNRLKLPPDARIWHYTTLRAVTAMLRERRMRLTRLNAFQDPFEGSVPKADVDAQVAVFSGHQAAVMMMEQVSVHYPGMGRPRKTREPWSAMTERRRAKTRSAHAICWGSTHESEAMWRLYCLDRRMKGQGLALQTTLAKLEASVAHDPDVYVSAVSYRQYHEGPGFTDELDAFMHKRQGFECEREVRVLKYDHPHYLALTRHLADEDDSNKKLPSELPKHRNIPWQPAGAVDSVIVSPYASKAYEDDARAAIAAIEPALPIELSVLSKRRYAAQF
jgi:hypothetical protein